MGKSHFIALDLSEKFVDKVSETCQQISETIITHSFDPMEKHVLHMTLCFLGGALSTNWKRKMVVLEDTMERFKLQFQGKVLEFDGYALFPETKRNLIVAKFRCVDRNFTPNVIEFKKSLTYIGVPEEDFFTAHLTLGKLRPAHINTDALEEFLNQLPPITAQINITGCHLIG